MVQSTLLLLSGRMALQNVQLVIGAAGRVDDFQGKLKLDRHAVGVFQAGEGGAHQPDELFIFNEVIVRELVGLRV